MRISARRFWGCFTRDDEKTSWIVTWIYLHTNGSLLLAALIHLAANFALGGLGALMGMYAILLTLLFLVVIGLDFRAWFGRRRGDSSMR